MMWVVLIGYIKNENFQTDSTKDPCKAAEFPGLDKVSSFYSNLFVKASAEKNIFD